MGDETAAGSSGAPDGGGHSPGGDRIRSPLQARAKFLKNWSWDDVIGINRGACERARSQHGANSETHGACSKSWEEIRTRDLTLLDSFETLRSFHKRAPFLFLNGNTFASIGRELSLVLFSDLPAVRQREAGSAAAHFIAGVLDREAMIAIIDALYEAATIKAGDRVRTFRGNANGVVIRILEDGRILWKTDAGTELIALPETLLLGKSMKQKR